MNSLSPGQLQELTDRLSQRKAALELEICNADSPVEHPEIAERAAMADDLAEAEVNEAEVERDLAEVRDIESALTRIAQGSYGTCTHCGAPVGFTRLQAEPSARRCIDCQREHEGQRGLGRTSQEREQP